MRLPGKRERSKSLLDLLSDQGHHLRVKGRLDKAVHKVGEFVCMRLCE